MTSTQHEEHIASLIVHCFPGQMSACRKKMALLPNTEIFHQMKQGKMIVVICSDGVKTLMENVDQIRDFPEVANVSLVYHQTGSPEEFNRPADTGKELGTYVEQVQSGAFSDFGEFK